MTSTTETSTDTTTDERAEFTAGLRELADLLDQQPELPLPNFGNVPWYLFGEGDLARQKAEARRLVRMLPGSARKWETGDLFRFGGSFHGVPWEVIVDRPAVCERVVVSTEEVTCEVPDPQALAQVPTTTVTETVEKVEWRCSPLLADEPTQAVAS